MMIASSSAFLLVSWLWISLHLNDAQVTLTLHQQFGLVPTIYRQSDGVSVTSYNENCVWKCSKANNPLAAFRFNGALTENYCLKNCTANGVNLEAEYTREKVSLRINFNRLNNGSRLQANFSCTEGFDPLINDKEVKNNQLQWNVFNIDSEHGWFKVKFPNGTFWRWRWRVRVDCEKSPTIVTITTPTTAPTTTATTSSNTMTTTSTTTSTTTLRAVSFGQITPVTPLPGEQFPTLSESTVSTEPSYLKLSTSSIADVTSSETDRATFNPQVLYPTVAGVGVALLVVCLALFYVRRRWIKKKVSDESPVADSTSLGPALPSVRYDPGYSDVDLNLPMSNPTYSLPQEHIPADEVSRKHPKVPSVPADELYAQVNKTTKPEEPYTADNLTYWSAEELAPYVQQKQDDPIGNEDSSNVLPNDLYAVVRRPNDETSSVLPNDDLYAVVRKPAHQEEKMAPIPRLNMTENDIYGT